MSDFFPLSIEADRVRPITPEYGLLRAGVTGGTEVRSPIDFGTCSGGAKGQDVFQRRRSRTDAAGFCQASRTL